MAPHAKKAKKKSQTPSKVPSFKKKKIKLPGSSKKSSNSKSLSEALSTSEWEVENCENPKTPQPKPTELSAYSAKLDKSSESLLLLSNKVPETKFLKRTSTVVQAPIRPQATGFQYFKDPSSNSFIIKLKAGSQLAIEGVIKARCILGQICVLGCNLSKSTKVYSLNGFGQLHFDVQTGCLDAERANLCPDIVKLVKNIEIGDALLEIEPVNDELLEMCATCMSKKLLPNISNESGYLANSTQCKFEYTSAENNPICHKYDSEFDKVYSYISVPTRFSNNKTVICGGKSVGKSTYCKYIVNRLISECATPVLFIDLDPGQSEFTVGGCLSVTLINECIVGPSFTHLATPERLVELECHKQFAYYLMQKSYFVGDISVSNCVSRYLLIVQHLIEFCQKTDRYGTIPWLINTMGFTHGVGYNILAKIIAIIHPNRVVEIRSRNKRNNFADSLEFGHVYRSLRQSQFFHPKVPTKLPSEYDLFACWSITDNMQQHQFYPKIRRELTICGYFGQLMNGSSSENENFLQKCVPFILKKSSINVFSYMATNLQPKHIWGVLNASLVALCTKQLQLSDDFGFVCIGYGIVRGIDDDNIYLITPLSTTDLANVKYLVHGNVHLPESLFTLNTNQLKSEIIPYVSIVEKHHSTRTPKRSHYNVHTLFNNNQSPE